MKRLILTAVATAGAFAMAPAANAAMFISYSVDGGATKTAIVSGSNQIVAGGSSGAITFTVGAQGAPLLASPDFSTNALTAEAANGAGGQIIFYFTQTDNTTFNGGLMSAFTSNQLQGSAQTVNVSSYYSAANANASLTGVGPGTLLQSNTFTDISTFTGGNAVNAVSPFSTTVVYTLNFAAGSGRFNTTADLTAVPEPATWAMMMLGFGAMGAMIRRRKTSTTARIRFA